MTQRHNKKTNKAASRARARRVKTIKRALKRALACIGKTIKHVLTRLGEAALEGLCHGISAVISTVVAAAMVTVGLFIVSTLAHDGEDADEIARESARSGIELVLDAADTAIDDWIEQALAGAH